MLVNWTVDKKRNNQWNYHDQTVFGLTFSAGKKLYYIACGNIKCEKTDRKFVPFFFGRSLVSSTVRWSRVYDGILWWNIIKCAAIIDEVKVWLVYSSTQFKIPLIQKCIFAKCIDFVLTWDFKVISDALGYARADT